MTKPKLYLFVGYPGAGKTTVSKIIEAATGATHLWADHVRWDMFSSPSHSVDESRQLYERLNQDTADLLAAGTSVIYDTNFNYRSDRDAMRAIAQAQSADVVLMWITTPLEVAHKRAVHSHITRNGYDMNMSHDEFNAIVTKLEPPTEDENPIKIDGTELDVAALKRHLSL